ncbi:hypothetical protein BKF61_000083 [Salmonella enterica subsp. enterica serovar Lika]|nr:hypothetical protein [Salmonella enterica subsp. enterica serovar Lika]EDV6731378.1 hypothetical protein [Salmonella enterica subsp. enterica serovar Lika]EKR0129214.1 hypothetical protein [Salmonella enterica]EKR0142825.1 hypothetical protein [Salmonella enterica]ELE5231136.1 hypothetical protein [Salmonella enterica subsp. enterica serovar Colindale]
MAIFDIEKDELLRLSDTQLEELIARLAEAEVAMHGHSPACVNWSGSITAPDGGIDIHVQVPVDQLKAGFLVRSDTVFQAKKHKMPKAAIEREIGTGKALSPIISEQARKQGSYIIVSLGDNCSPSGKKDRLKAMRDAVKDDPNESYLHLDFYDRSKLIQWLRQHPSVMLWVKAKLGQGYSGWQPYGAWSNPPQGVTDTLISAPGVTITLPSGKGQKLKIDEAINPMRALIRSTNKAVRITGLSGVGKTRIVQALFDETVGTDALDRTVAIYVDTGYEPVPSATAMLDNLLAEGRRAIMILDNCPSELHASLASKVSAAGKEVSLITIEYDIRDDKPQTTAVIHIETDGPEVAEQLLIRRFPSIGQNNARRIAEFADGNARVALAIAERVEEGESLALLSDAQLFNRLFEQRNHPDGHLREQAEILSLVYSFSISSPGAATDELEILGALSGYPKIQLFKTVTKLMERHVVQKRSHWRAILPHAIANKLAASALNSIPIDQLRTTFEAPDRQRLLMSFAHRLGLLHSHAVAKEMVEAWLQPEGLLGKIIDLDDVSTRILNYVAPVAPGALLERIEETLVTSNFEHFKSRYNPQRTAIIKLLQLLAYESKYFERCIKLLIRIADQESASNNYDSARNKIKRFFQPYLSGTHASLEQRVAVMNECIGSSMAGRRRLGLEMLETALGGPPWTGFGINEFGARPRDYGFRPSYDELVEWLITFIDIVVRLATSRVPELEDNARLILANKFRWIWRQEGMRSKLIDAARKLHAHRPWGEGWKAVRSTIYFSHTKRKDNEDIELLSEILVTLERELEPNDLVPAVMAYVLSKGRDFWALDADYEHQGPNKFSEIRKILGAKAFKLGHDFAVSTHGLDELCPNLFLRDGMPYRVEFGKGLANGAPDLRIYWQQLIIQLDLQHKSQSDVSVIRGFIEETHSIDSALAQELLDQCAQHSELRFELVNLHPWQEFTEIDLDRCMSLLDDSDIHPHMYGAILWGEQFSNLPESRVLELAQRLLNKPNGDEVVLEALSMKLADKGDGTDTLGLALRRIGLSAAIQRFRRDHNDLGGYLDYAMERVIDATLRFDGNEAEKLEWLSTIFAVVDEHFGYIYSFEDAISITAAWMPKEFLSRIFDGTEDQQQRRLHFINYDDSHQSPIAKIDVDLLIEWCGTNKDPQVWASVASGINLWSKDGEQSPLCLQGDALRFLEASPEPRAVLEIFAEHVAPSSWSGSRANVMQPRVEAIGQLVTHERADISKSARAVYEKLTDWVEKEKERERLEDEALEQRFE